MNNMGVMVMTLENKGFFTIDEELAREMGINITRDKDGRVVEVLASRRRWDPAQGREVKSQDITKVIYKWSGDLQARGNA
jgi:hypothetical protein